ncbi:hypothetical protein L917_20336 [Phytophthora nicotianae]|uniref:Uncharacterized protein n=1 Tax=Phytophthora nicotianae TaxID=4792 RepID=W2K306_PHYNI|nr:hypothetical protein L917_20336 [Phytophthora nicotianae]
MKISLKQMIARLASDDEESIPAVVVFSVDVFNGLYTSICMQSSGTWWASFLMIALNGGYTVLSILEINRAAALLSKLDRKNGIVPQVSHSIVPILDACSHSSSLHKTQRCATSVKKLNAAASRSGKMTIKESKLAMSSKLLFYLEYRALVGYIEGIIPLMYAAYLSILVNLPSAKYYPHTRSLSSEQLNTTVGSIMAYASTENLSLLWLHVVVKRKLGFSLLYQLAFVLETEAELLQGRLFVVFVISKLQYSANAALGTGTDQPSPTRHSGSRIEQHA